MFKTRKNVVQAKRKAFLSPFDFDEAIQSGGATKQELSDDTSRPLGEWPSTIQT
jgi:hypothetical protein